MEDIEELHRLACKEGDNTYRDPSTGYNVFTAVAHRKRGRCCGNGCRHCPYGHMNVKDPARRRNGVSEPVFLRFGDPTEGAKDRSNKKARCELAQVVVLFFSGGKDSYLALRRLERNSEQVVLLSTFSGPDSMVGHQQVPFWEVVVEQAKAMRKHLLAVPLGAGTYPELIAKALALLPESGLKATALCFGDLHVPYIKEWREEHLRPLLPSDAGAAPPPLRYPVWHIAYEELINELEADEADVRICRVDNDCCPPGAGHLVRVGAAFNAELFWQLQELKNAQGGRLIDAFGENGEFHSVVLLPGMKRLDLFKHTSGE